MTSFFDPCRTRQIGWGSVLSSAAKNGDLLDKRRRVNRGRRGVITAGERQFTRDAQSPGSPTNWDRIVGKLKQAKVPCVSSDQLLSAKGSGLPVIDVRPQKEYEAGFIEDSVNIPLYDLIEGWSARKAVTRLGFLAFGVMNGTELKEDFFDRVAEFAAEDDALVLVCGQGGALSTDSPGQKTMPTRSLIAAHELVCNGYRDVRVLRPGIKGWEAEGRDMMMMVDE